MSAANEYLKHSGQDQRELVLKHAELVKRIAYHLVGRMPASVDVDDLIQAGTIGLLLAGRNFRPDQGANFETYAGIRIRGAMIDEVRRSDWTPRSVYRKIREASQAVKRIENQTGTKARDQDIADEMNISLDEYHQLQRDATACRLFSLDEPEGDDDMMSHDPATDEPEPSDRLEQEDSRALLVAAIEELPERERLVMSLYYDEELNLREIGEVLGVSESRVCQIHGQALIRVRAQLDE